MIRNIEILNELVRMAKEAGGHIKIKNEPYMPLTVELLEDDQVTLCHYGELNGDLMADPEVIFSYSGVGTTSLQAKAIYYRNDYAGYEKYEDCTAFADGWLQNIKEQGYVRLHNNNTA